jgi:outer membrane immunogenic protein
MKRAITLGIGLLALAGMTLPTSAADLGRPIGKAPVMAPPPVLGWTGFYVGLGLGWRGSEEEWTTTCLQPTLAPGCPTNNTLFPGRFNTDNPATFDVDGFRVSVYGGYNWQIANWVIGIEADAGWADNETVRFGIPGTHLTGLAGGDVSSVRDNWDVSLRGRLGWLVTPQALLYVTGGVSWLDKEVSAACTAGSFGAGGWCAFNNATSVSETMIGWTVGAGIEWMFAPNWIARAEYRYADYTGDALNLRFFGANPIDTFDANIDAITHTAYFGIAYKF